MSEIERRLLVQLARLLAELLLWKNVDLRNEALQMLKTADEVEKMKG